MARRTRNSQEHKQMHISLSLFLFSPYKYGLFVCWSLLLHKKPFFFSLKKRIGFLYRIFGTPDGWETAIPTLAVVLITLELTRQSQSQTSDRLWWVKFKTTTLCWLKHLWQVTGPWIETQLPGPFSKEWGNPRASWGLGFLWSVLPVLLPSQSHLKTVLWVLPRHKCTAFIAHFLPRMEVGALGLRFFSSGSWLLCHYFTTLSNTQ